MGGDVALGFAIAPTASTGGWIGYGSGSLLWVAYWTAILLLKDDLWL
jgi:hypothetical protein